MSSQLNILLLGDYSHCHASLAEGLRMLGHRVTVISDGSDWMHTPNDINISRRSGKLGGAILYLKTLSPLHKYLKGYDIVSIHDPHFLPLKPKRLEILFNRLIKENGSIFYTAMSTDIFYLDMLKDKKSPLKYSEWFINGKPSRWMNDQLTRWNSWESQLLRNYQQKVFNNLDGAVAVLYEYWEGLRYGLSENKIGYAGIPINTDTITNIGCVTNDKIRIVLGRDRNRIKMKGSDYLEEAALRVYNRHKNDIEFEIIENIPYLQFLHKLSRADIVLDQIYSYTPSTTPLIAMAMGKTVVSGAEPEYYKFIGERDNFPIVNAALTVDELENSLETLIKDKDYLKHNGEMSRKFIEKHNDYLIVARRFLDFWRARLRN